MEELRELFFELGQPGAEKLYTVARKRMMNVTKEQAKEVSREGVRPVFDKPFPQQGKIATNQGFEGGVQQGRSGQETKFARKNLRGKAPQTFCETIS